MTKYLLLDLPMSFLMELKISLNSQKVIVQGVGFRPFLFNLMKKVGLNGVIINKGNVGVEIITNNNEKKNNVKR